MFCIGMIPGSILPVAASCELGSQHRYSWSPTPTQKQLDNISMIVIYSPQYYPPIIGCYWVGARPKVFLQGAAIQSSSAASRFETHLYVKACRTIECRVYFGR